MSSLIFANLGEEYIVKKIDGTQQAKAHLSALGFTAGATVKVVSALAGNFIVTVRDSRVALTKELAQSVLVKPLKKAKKPLGFSFFHKKESVEPAPQAEGRTKTLKDAAIGEVVIVKKLYGEGAIKRRIMDMGITKGTQLVIRKVAPLGDPIEINVRGYELSLRKEDAEKIEVE